ncbi:MAG: hypothetical protein LUG50_08925 [Planctomycetaceae bacterium]|nr:hypothetical protein [Planctomycetaceae bacterium]
MPELPEVETVVTALAGALTGRTVTALEQRGALRYPLGREAPALLSGRVVSGIRRRAKYIVFAFDDCPHGLLAHLGMTGSFRIEPATEPFQKHDRLAIGLDGGESLRFADMRRFGFVKLVGLDPATGDPDDFARLGPEPLGRSFTGRELLRRSAGRTCPIKNHIMNQEVVVGVGNIYASEALFIAGISPERPAGDLAPAEADALVAAIKKSAPRRDPVGREHYSELPYRGRPGRRVPTGYPGLWPGRGTLPPLWRNGGVDSPGRPVDVLLPGLPALNAPENRECRHTL